MSQQGKFHIEDIRGPSGKGQSVGKKYIFHCPGCECLHSYDVRTDGGRPNWTFNGDFDRPTFSPSLLYPDRICHLFLTDGKIRFLGDCTHKLAGQVVEMVDP